MLALTIMNLFLGYAQCYVGISELTGDDAYK